MTKVAIISPESIDDFSGGSIYLRGILAGLKNTESYLSLYCKRSLCDSANIKNTESFRVIRFNRTKIKDILALFFLQMTFLSFHALEIIRTLKKDKVDVVLIHGDKLWVMVVLIRLLLRKPVVVMSDNIEYLLGVQMYRKEASYLNKFKYLIFTLYAYLSEYISLKFSSLNTFITCNDLTKARIIYKFKSDSLVWPVTLEKGAKVPERLETGSYGLFTGSFRFPPNKQAALAAVELCEFLGVKLVLAGLDAGNLPIKSKNVELVDCPSHDEMKRIFENAFVFVSPVFFGSGMKTKVAEALKFGLPIICSEHSLIGYDQIRNENFICILDNKTEVNKFIRDLKIIKSNKIRYDAFDAFNTYYSEQRSKLCAEEVFKKLGINEV